MAFRLRTSNLRKPSSCQEKGFRRRFDDAIRRFLIDDKKGAWVLVTPMRRASVTNHTRFPTVIVARPHPFVHLALPMPCPMRRFPGRNRRLPSRFDPGLLSLLRSGSYRAFLTKWECP